MPNILITAGGTQERIDDVRVITNLSTGRLGALTADAFATQKADVTFVCGVTSALPENKTIKIIKIESAEDLKNTLIALLKKEHFDAVIHAMAVSDYTPVKQKGKISSDKKTLTITLKRTPKIISLIKRLSPATMLVGFKLLSNVSEEELLLRARETLLKNKCSFVLANDLKNINSAKHKALLIDANNKIQRTHTKQQAAHLIARAVLSPAGERV